MIIRFLGTGSAFSMKNYHPNLLIEENEKKMLIDAGGDIRFSLRDIGLSSKDIECVYITHLHSDHIGGMEYLAFTSYFDPTRSRPTLFCHALLVEDLWSHSLKGGLSSVQGKVLNIYDYFDVNPLNNGHFKWENIKFQLKQAIHVYNGFTAIPTFGLLMQSKNGPKVYLTGDTQFTPEHLNDAYIEADVIIHDCETSPFKTDVHSHYDDLKTLNPQLKSKMYLWHYQDNVVDQFDEWQQKALDDGFKGFLKKGQILKF